MSGLIFVPTRKHSLGLLIAMDSLPASLPPIALALLKGGSIELGLKADTHSLWPLRVALRTTTGWQSTLSAGIIRGSEKSGGPGVASGEEVVIRFILEDSKAGSGVEGYSTLPGYLGEEDEGPPRKFLSRSGG